MAADGRKYYSIRHCQYEVSPLHLVWDDENYYLVAYDEKAGKVKHYRVDKMRNMELMLEVIPLARNNEKKLAGIVVNAFTEPFVLDAQIWDIVENMKSRIENGCHNDLDGDQSDYSDK